MGTLSIWHWLIILVIVAFLFGGRGKLSGIMGDAAKGIKAFKEGLKDEEKEADVAEEAPPAKPLPKAPAAKSRAAARPKAPAVRKPAAKPAKARAKTKA